MKTFGRSLKNLAALEENKTSAPQWWRDLLTMWRPSGEPAGTHGLRLAVRDNSINFYAMGQSVAKVTIDRKSGMPTAKTHIKYLLGKKNESESAGQEYVTLTEKGFLRKSVPWRSYQDMTTLEKIIESAQSYSGYEKREVDNLTAVNPNVIDLEMGLPAKDGERNAPRIDIVALEDGAVPKVVLWEAKLIQDSRIRCSGPVVEKTSPEVLAQLYQYQEFLSVNSQLVSSAYGEAARILLRLRKLADECGPTRRLGPLIRRAATLSEPLEVERSARLIVLHRDVKVSPANWPKHMERLKDHAWVTTVDHTHNLILPLKP